VADFEEDATFVVVDERRDEHIEGVERLEVIVAFAASRVVVHWAALAAESTGLVVAAAVGDGRPDRVEANAANPDPAGAADQTAIRVEADDRVPEK